MCAGSYQESVEVVMEDEILTVKEVAEYLKMNPRTVYKLAQDGQIPGVKIASQWRFKKSLVNEWLELEMRRFPSRQLERLEEDHGARVPNVSDLLSERTVSTELRSRTKHDVLKELVELSLGSGRVKASDALLTAIRRREELCSTGIEKGVAVPHPRPALTGMIEEPVVAFGLSKRGIDFGSLDGKPTHLFFLLCAPNDSSQLKVLARLSRLLRDEHLREALKSATRPEEVIGILAAKEAEGEQEVKEHATGSDA